MRREILWRLIFLVEDRVEERENLNIKDVGRRGFGFLLLK